MAIVINPNFEADCTKDDQGKKVWTRNFVLRDSAEASIDPDDAYAAAYNYAVANQTYDG